MKSMKELYSDRANLITKNRELLDAVEQRRATGGRSLSASEREEYDRRDREIDSLTSVIESRTSGDTVAANAKYDKMLNGDPVRQTSHRSGSAADRMELDFGRHTLTVSRGDDLAIRASDDYVKAFDHYLANGDRGAERLGLVAGKDDKGGYAIPTPIAAKIIKFVDDAVFLRRLGTVLPPLTEAVSLGAVSLDTDPGDADWTPEVPATDITEDDGMTLGKRELMPHGFTKLVKASDTFLRAAGRLPGGAAGFIGWRLGYKFAVTEEKAFLTGSGVQQPLGVFTVSDDGIPASRDTVCASATDFTADEVISSLYALKPQYQDKATGLFSREFVRRLRLKKDGNGQYLWQPGLVAGQPDRVLARPYIQSEFVPSTYTTGRYVGMWGDFSHYWIQDTVNMPIERLDELFRLRNQRGFIGHREVDGQPVLAEAFSRLRLA